MGDIDVPPDGLGDFSGWCEIYLGNRWYTFDACHNIPRLGRILMVRGHDAANAVMITSFGAYGLTLFRVWTDELPDRSADDDFTRLLAPDPRTAGRPFIDTPDTVIRRAGRYPKPSPGRCS